ncbi:hypothetical protein HX045_06560 [Myroides odoratimimus]|uniref:Uncharacterized protein n=1 Tax=Myroides odoratimimus CIP 101113 TaxID=883154 RepID=A0AAV3F7B0_9FLAO|nr:hypothetical protein [Myroides odoratimimus]EHO15182.1 hypothetical protein HMPREF9715_00370 [Myroides odoratimimus CIP 101113]MCA4804880.1 hypothetical protein [Myroides odoratimimus]MDM1064733.1 hypothetical protein [Myroides odoratimimus]MDM1400715.1 hypothetical protein [Myroides odoratimimus]MDM1410183.1 hypothetical protein [Myroides odoratimimus]
MMKQLYFAMLAVLFSALSFAQTKIGTSPDINKDAMLEVESADKGLLLPRVELTSTTLANPLSAHVAGMTVYNTKAVNDVVVGFYYNDGTKWQQMVTKDYKAVKFFYMPSIVFDTSEDRVGQTMNLFEEYKKQFSLQNSNHFVSEGAPTTGIPYFEKPTDLYYYVTSYDTDVFTIKSISKEGVMTYDVKAAATDCTIMNIIFVVKD